MHLKCSASEPNIVECFLLIWLFHLARFSLHHGLQWTLLLRMVWQVHWQEPWRSGLGPFTRRRVAVVMMVMLKKKMNGKNNRLSHGSRENMCTVVFYYTVTWSLTAAEFFNPAHKGPDRCQIVGYCGLLDSTYTDLCSYMYLFVTAAILGLIVTRECFAPFHLMP